MTINDLLDIAIQQEIASQKLYSDMLFRVTDKKARSFLETLVKEEKGHEDILATIKEMELYDGTIVITDIPLTKDVAESHSTKANTEKDMSTQTVLEIALQREHRARTVFLHLAENSKDAEIKLMFEKLADEELNHHNQIQKKYSMLQGEMGFEM